MLDQAAQAGCDRQEKQSNGPDFGWKTTKTTFWGGSHGYGHGKMSANRTRDPNGHED
jgi:hypothetical protein